MPAKYVVEYLNKINCVIVVFVDVLELRLEKIDSSTLSVSYHTKETNHIEHQDIQLPKKINIILKEYTFIKGPKGEFTLRLNVSPANIPRNALLEIDNIEKWSKKELTKLTNFIFKCKKCENDLIASSNCDKLNDMPSEFWKELMDYWHCHKPTISDGSVDTYSTMYNSLRPASKELLIGGSYLLTNPGLLKDHTIIDTSNTDILCIKCQNNLGEITKDNLYKLYKWNLKLSNETEFVDEFSAIDDVLVSLLNYARDQSGRYMLMKYKDREVLLWLFNVDVCVILNDGTTLPNAFKILFSEDQKLIKDIGSKHNVDEVTVQEQPFKECMDELENRNKLLPNIVATFGEWSVGYTQLYYH